MATTEHYRQRAARLREALKTLDDPLAKIAIGAIVEALEELAAESEEKKTLPRQTDKEAPRVNAG